MTSSKELFEQAKKYIPGGVNSPVRAFNSVGGCPVFFSHAQGAYLYSEEGEKFIDYVGSWGPMILGHAHPAVINAVKNACDNSLSFGAPTHLEIKLAEKICALMPSIEQVRMVSSGTEATMSAIRLARGYTKRDKIIKFNGCYHGHADHLLVKAGSGALTFGVPTSAGVPESFAEHTLIAEFNDLGSVDILFKENPSKIAAIILEPIAGNMNCILPEPGFLKGLRELCDEHQTLLIFDEVMTGFRVALGGAQSLFNIKPDLTTLGKIVGGGMPVGAFGGRADIMQNLAPVGPVYQAGTLSGNPVAMTAGIKTLELISNPNFHKALGEKTNYLMSNIADLAKQAGLPFLTQHACGMFGLFFTAQEKISTFSEVQNCNIQQFNAFFHHMLKNHIYLAPSAYEAGFLSNAHTYKDLENTLEQFEYAFKVSATF